MSISERKKEINCRRKRRAQLTKFKEKLPTMNEAEKANLVIKLRRMTVGAEQLIKDWGLEG